MLRLALSPRWVLMLLLALGVAAAFAALGQWQISRAVDHDPAVPGATEQLQSLSDVASPAEAVRTEFVGQRVSVQGAFVAGDDIIISNRLNGGVEGFWIVGQFDVDEPGHPALAVARGWTESRAVAEAALEELRMSDADAEAGTITVEGRLVPNEAPVRPAEGAASDELTSVALAALVNRWSGLDDRSLYLGYVVAAEPASDLVAIDSPQPETAATVNWLNVFYAVEWVVFAGFAVFLWYRLLRDDFERRQEEAEEAEQAAAAGAQQVPTRAP